MSYVDSQSGYHIAPRSHSAFAVAAIVLFIAIVQPLVARAQENGTRSAHPRCEGEVCAVLGAALSRAVPRFNGPLKQQAYIKASNTEYNDLFGWSVALSGDGNTLAVSAVDEDSNATGINGNQADNSAKNAGAVYVFVRSNGVWSQQAYLKSSSVPQRYEFGESLRLSHDGNTLAVGALDGPTVGGVYIFLRSGTTWAQQAILRASNAGPEDYFGTAVALSGDGNTVAVGAIGGDSNSSGVNGDQANNLARDSGAVYVFTRAGTSWSLQAYVKASNPQSNDKFGMSVALSNDGATLAVGATGQASSTTGVNGNEGDFNSYDAGAVYVFKRSGISWSQQAFVKASNTGSNDRFGMSVALSGDGNTLAVGAEGESSSATGINGNQTDNNASAAGAVYVFSRTGNTWTQQAYVKASNTSTNDYFGHSVALSADGGTLAVGAYYEDSSATGINGNQQDNNAPNSGAVYVFTRVGGIWSQIAYVKASNTGGGTASNGYWGDWFGYSVALSGDGSTLAVSAIMEASATTGVDGPQGDDSAAFSGAVYVFVGADPAADPSVLPVPNSPNWMPAGGNCSPLAAPVRSSDPMVARPLGQLVFGSDFGLTLDLGAIAGPVDVYILARLPNSQQLMLNGQKQWSPISGTAMPFLASTTGPVTLTDATNNLISMPVSGIAPGIYSAYVVMVPGGTDPASFNLAASSYYLWCFNKTF